MKSRIDSITDPAVAGMDPAALDRATAAIEADIRSGRHFGASLLVARGGQIVHHSNLGTVAPDRPTQADDRYLLMSMSKAFTATMVLQAIDRGRFTLDTRVADIYPAFATGGKERATIRQLLTHTTGLPFGMVPPGMPLEAAGNLERTAAAIAAVPAGFAPGSRCLYTSGLGFDFLGQLLVETDPNRRPFREILHDDLFSPLGMRHTSFGLSTDDPKRVPVSFTAAQSPSNPAVSVLLNKVFDDTVEFPSGNAYSTIDDVFRFTEMLRGRGAVDGTRILSPALFDYARQNHTGGLVNEAFTPESLAKGLDPLRANFTLLGGYVRGTGHGLTPAGLTASPQAITAVGGASTGYLIDFERDVTVIFLSAGFIEGLDHLARLQRINDLVLSAVED